MQKMGQNYEKDELLRIFQEIDTDEGGTIDAKEFADWYIEEEKLQKKLQKRQVGVDAGPASSSSFVLAVLSLSVQ